jgi:hypothetical protein
MAKVKAAKMSNSKYELQCFEVLSTFVILIDEDINNSTELQLHLLEIPNLTLANIDSHLTICVPCSLELIHERSMRDLTRTALKRTCNEEAPADLHESLTSMFNQANFSGFKNEVITEFSMHEVTIEIDEFGSIKHREIRIESRQEFHVEDEN